jgi:hypothetical protein
VEFTDLSVHVVHVKPVITLGLECSSLKTFITKDCVALHAVHGNQGSTSACATHEVGDLLI